MKLSELLSTIEIITRSSNSDFDCDIEQICHDSRKALKNSVFVCKSGAISDGHVYAPKAYENGARVFVAEKPLALPRDALVCIVKNSSDALSALAQKFYDYPSNELKIVGITGTKGKTTLSLSAYKIGAEYGLKIGYIGTNGVQYGNICYDAQNTTPDVLELQKTLREMADYGIKYVMLEISSQALWQKRTDGLKFFATVFTNLYHDHIGGVEHPTLEHYKESKKSLFTDYDSAVTITNSDSPDSDFMTADTTAKKIIRVSANGDKTADLYAEDIRHENDFHNLGTKFSCHGQNFCGENVFIPSIGNYSVENTLQTIAICLSLDIDKNFIIDSLKTLSVKGRCEIVPLKSKPNSLFVIDYAHNGAGLSSVLRALREYNPKRIVCLFGSVGDRTECRREELATVAKQYADVIIVTSDNPGNEAPISVINDICKHLADTDKPTYKFEDRAEAVRFAVQIATDGDIVLLAGKGHENYQLVKGRKIEFSEKQILADCDTQ